MYEISVHRDDGVRIRKPYGEEELKDVPERIEIYSQIVDELDLKAVIAAVNRTSFTEGTG